MRNWQTEIENRVKWIKEILDESKSKGIVVNLSGGKDCSVVVALCKKATDNILGIGIPIGNLDKDMLHAKLSAESFGVKYIEVDLQDVFTDFAKKLEDATGESLEKMALANIKPRLRMIVAYSLGYGYLVAGTGNLSERTMGYFTKWGDGACDFNPIGDLTASEVFELGYALNVPKEILEKAPSAGLWEGQTDEQEMGISYEKIDKYIKTGEATEEDKVKIDSYYRRSEHKREMPKIYKG